MRKYTHRTGKSQMSGRRCSRRSGLGRMLALAVGVLGFLETANAQVPKVALSFNGESYVETEANAGNLGIDGNAAKTVEAWAYTRAFDDSGAIFSHAERKVVVAPKSNANASGNAFCVESGRWFSGIGLYKYGFIRPHRHLFHRSQGVWTNQR